MEELFLGIDLGGTTTKAGLVDAAGQLRERRSAPTPAAAGPAAVVEQLCRTAQACLEAGGAVRGVAIGCPGTVDPRRGVVLFSPNLHGWHNVPLRRMVQEQLALPCVVDNDANMAALGEQWLGAGRGASSLVLLTLGTGVGGGIVLDGRVWHGAVGAAGEVGHMVLNLDGPPCGCGNRGCLESYASATAMVRRMRESLQAGEESSLSARADDFTAEDIYQAALAGDRAALRNMQETARYLGMGVVSLLHVLNPEVVAIGGGVAAAGEMLLEPLRDEIGKRTLTACRESVRICLAQLGNEAGIVGAARSLMEP